MEKRIIKEDLKTSSIVVNCAGYDVKYFRALKAFFKVFRLSQKLVITNTGADSALVKLVEMTNFLFNN